MGHSGRRSIVKKWEFPEGWVVVYYYSSRQRLQQEQQQLWGRDDKKFNFRQDEESAGHKSGFPVDIWK